MDEDYLFPESESEKERKKSRFERDLEKLGSVNAVKAAVTEPAAEGVSMARKRGGSAAVRAALAAAAEDAEKSVKSGESETVIPYDDISDIVLPELDFMTSTPVPDGEPPITDVTPPVTVVEPIVSQAPVYADIEPEDDDFSKYILSKEDIEKSAETSDSNDVIISSDDGLSDFSIEDFAVEKKAVEDYPVYTPNTSAEEPDESEEQAIHLDFASIASEAFDEEALAEYGRNITFDGEAPVPKYIPPKDDLSVLEGIIGKSAAPEAGVQKSAEPEAAVQKAAEPDLFPPVKEAAEQKAAEQKAPEPGIFPPVKNAAEPDLFPPVSEPTAQKAPAPDLFPPVKNTAEPEAPAPDLFPSAKKAAEPDMFPPVKEANEIKAPDLFPPVQEAEEPEAEKPEKPEAEKPENPEAAQPEPPKTPAARAAIAAAEDLAKIAAAVEAELAEQSSQESLVKEREEREALGTRHDPVITKPQRDDFDGVAAKTPSQKALLENETAKIKEPAITHQPRPVKKIISRHDLNDDVIIEQRTNSLPVLGELGDEMGADGSRVSAKSKRSDDDIALMRKQEAIAMNVLSEDSSDAGKNRILRITMDEAEKIIARRRFIGRIMLYSANILTILAAIIGIMFFEHNDGLAFLFRAAIIFGAAGFIPVSFLQKVIAPFFVIFALFFVMLGMNENPDAVNIIFYVAAVIIMLCAFAVRVFSFSVKELLKRRR
jgi:hypothetical protein